MRASHYGTALLLTIAVALVAYVAWRTPAGSVPPAKMHGTATAPPGGRSEPAPPVAASPEPEPEERRSEPGLEGVVLDHQGFRVADLPLVFGLESEAGGSSEHAVSSDRSGRFRLPSPAPGRYRLRSADPRYAITGPTELALEPGSRDIDLEVRVHPQVSITGRTLDDHGEPLSGVSVRTRGLVSPKLFVSGPVLTDPGGFFTIVTGYDLRAAESMAELATDFEKELRAGSPEDPRLASEVCIVFEHAGFRVHSESVALDRGPVDLGAVSLEGARIRLEGRVTNHRGDPIAATLEFQHSEAPREGAKPATRCSELPLDLVAASGNDGYFEIALDRSGGYDVWVTTRKYRPRSIQIDVGDAPEPVSIRLD